MTRIAVLLAEGFEEIEAVTIIDVLRRAEFETKIVGVTGDLVHGNHQIGVKTDLPIDRARSETWDLLVLPGGMPGAATLRDDRRVIEWIRSQDRVAAICAAPIALAKAGVLAGKRATSYPAFKDQLGDVSYAEDAVVIDGGVITSRGPATAMAFALTLVEVLAGKTKRDALAEKMLFRG